MSGWFEDEFADGFWWYKLYCGEKESFLSYLVGISKANVNWNWNNLSFENIQINNAKKV
jgi:hypothetical protein